MFILKYKIFDNDISNLEEEEFYGEYGYFQILINDKEYGFFLEKELETLSTSIYQWIINLVHMALEIDKELSLCVSDIESFNSWIGFCYDNKNTLKISEIKTDNKFNLSAIEKMSKLSNKELVWQEKIYINMFNEEVINVAEDYIKEIKLLNKNTNHYILELENSLIELKKKVSLKNS